MSKEQYLKYIDEKQKELATAQSENKKKIEEATKALHSFRVPKINLQNLKGSIEDLKLFKEETDHLLEILGDLHTLEKNIEIHQDEIQELNRELLHQKKASISNLIREALQ